MVVLTEDGLDRICEDLERRKAAGEKFATHEEYKRRAREKLIKRPDNDTTE